MGTPVITPTTKTTTMITATTKAITSTAAISATTTVASPSQSCYIAQCGCPGAFKEKWCLPSHYIDSKWCQQDSSNCEGACNGHWCTPIGGRRLERALDTVV